ncbi:outer membrane protein assembly factor BamC [Hydrotalea sandarakina]|uniref:NlpB/DapX lipoprotein n=1 Tax=Hydrotalea sandarakina TaxID=1004304 RepID=A0A2W7TF52_9BACT|nr:outer membrane protein assembly factor BamC [Hydrotalea sandarakina]PZX61942.1 NlpB/DapX lipoprotein [Hydrotalea sandarakina]
MKIFESFVLYFSIVLNNKSLLNEKKLRLFNFVLVFLIIGCNNKVIPLKNSYQSTAYEFSTALDKDETWSALIDLFTTKGLPIKTIDKADGVITTDYVSFLNSYTWENKDGSLINPNAFVVCSKFRGPFTLTTSFTPTTLTGQWLVRIKQVSGKTVVNIKLANAKGTIGSGDINSQGDLTSVTPYDLQVESTGIFEKSVQDKLK